MTPYRDWDQDSGIRAYAVGSTHMDVAFKDGAIYRYTSVSATPRCRQDRPIWTA
jgi:hypothetical protein